MNVRILNKNDIEIYKTLLDRNYAGKEKITDVYVHRQLLGLHTSGPNSQYKVYGGFDDSGILTSAMAVHYWDKLPFYSFMFMITHPKYSSMSFNKSFIESGLSTVMTTAVYDAESVDRWQFFYITLIQNFKTRKSAWFDQCPALTNRYDWYVDTVIPKGTLPKSEVFSKIIYDEPRTKDLVVKTARLKPSIIFNKMHDRKLIDFTYEELYPENEH